jgi:hypothetical protein
MDTLNNNFTNITSSETTTDFPAISGVNLSFSFQFWFSLSFHVPSLLCYSVVLTYILTKKSQRQALHNHSIIVLLFIALFVVLFDYSWTLDSDRRGKVWLQTPAFCEIWWFLDYGFYNACTVVLAWASFERHILIFHSHLISTKRRRILIHYLPLISILLYLDIFYTYAIFFPPCQNEYDYRSPACGAYPCYLGIQSLGIWDTIAHGIIPTFLVAIFNAGLFVAILRQKRQYHRNWKKYRKMAFQLFSISALFLSLNFPLAITFLVQLSGYPEWGVQAQLYLYYFSALIQYLLPFVCLPYVSKIWPRMKAFFRRYNRRVVPMVITRTIRAQQQESRM